MKFEINDSHGVYYRDVPEFHEQREPLKLFNSIADGKQSLRPPLARIVQVQLCFSEHYFIFLFVSFNSKYSEFFPIELTVLFCRILS